MSFLQRIYEQVPLPQVQPAPLHAPPPEHAPQLAAEQPPPPPPDGEGAGVAGPGGGGVAPVCAQSATQHFLPPGPHPTDPLGRAPPHLVFSEGSPAGHTSPGLFLVQMNFSTMYVGELVVCFVGVGVGAGVLLAVRMQPTSYAFWQTTPLLSMVPVQHRPAPPGYPLHPLPVVTIECVNKISEFHLDVYMHDQTHLHTDHKMRRNTRVCRRSKSLGCHRSTSVWSTGAKNRTKGQMMFCMMHLATSPCDSKAIIIASRQ